MDLLNKYLEVSGHKLKKKVQIHSRLPKLILV
jgi:hypothetical protein